MPFRPRLWPTLFSVPMLIALLALGTWQVERLQWKEDLIAKLKARSTAAPLALPERPQDLERLEYRRLRTEGEFLHDKEMHLVNRSLNGNPGVHVLTPLVRPKGPAVLVSRGWVPFDKKDPSTRPRGQVSGPVKVEGIVRLEKGQGMFQPDNDPVTNHWFFVDTAAMAKAVGRELAPGFYILSGDSEVPGGFPVGHQWRIDIRNDHLEYAITWYALAAALMVIYVVYHMRPQ